MVMKNKKGQNFIEYGLILGIVTVALLGMQTYFKRGVQSVIKVVADDYGPQGTPSTDIEMQIKKKVYGKTEDGGEGKVMTQSTARGTWTQQVENKGESNIYTKITGTREMTADSVWIGGDYKTRGPERESASPPATSAK